MTNFKKQFVSVVAASAVLLQIATPIALADTSITISGNGSDSDNTATVKNTNSNTVLQSNTANVTNTVHANADTGGNTAKDNTGGGVKIVTGDATVHSTVENTLNSNAASVGCNCGAGDTTVSVTGNGSDSDNNVKLSNKNTNQITQSNDANVKNKIDANASTGDNYGKDNTGGDVKIYTGDAKVTSNVSTLANANVAQIGGGNGSQNGDLSAVISGNGSDSDNDVNLYFKDKNNIWQANDAYVKNHVDASAETGDNSAKDNTGGTTGIWTGDATAWAGVDNSVNFNSAALDCGCLTDVTAKVAGNGSDSDNDLKAKFLTDNGVFQGGEGYGNDATLKNYVNPDAQSGNNDAKDNTGPVLSDPWILTGDASASDGISNSGNVNTFGSPIELPGDLGNMDFHFSFDFNGLFSL